MSTTCKSDSRVTGPRRVQTAVVLPNKPVVLESEWNPGQLKIKPEGVVLKIKGGVHSVFTQRLRKYESALSKCLPQFFGCYYLHRRKR